MRKRTFRVGCTIEVEHTASSLHAHVTLDNNVDIQPGDEVTIQGDPITPAFGESYTLRRHAVVKRASWFEDQWTRIMGRLEMRELLENSFTEWRKA